MPYSFVAACGVFVCFFFFNFFVCSGLQVEDGFVVLVFGLRIK
jgi:hypothetical protein